MKIKSYLFIPLLLTGFTLQAQEQWSLEKCFSYAFEHNLDIQQQHLNTEDQDVQMKQAKNSIWPNLNARFSHNYNFGRSLNFDNTYSDINSMENNFSVGTNVPIFKGLQIQNNIKQQEVNFQASIKDLEKVKDDVTILITSAYMEVLFNKELVEVAQSQLDVSKEQVQKDQIRFETGEISKVILLESKAQEAREEVNLVETKNRRALSLLDLAQILDLDNPRGFDIEIPELPLINANVSLLQAGKVYDKASLDRPEVKSAELKLESSELGLKMAKGAHYPELSLFANYYNLYNNKYEDANGEKISFKDQIKNNERKGFGLNLDIPIFNRLATRHQISQARINVERQNVLLDQVKNTLRKNIQQAYANALASLKKYQSTQEAVLSMEEAFRYTAERYNLGMVTSADYNSAKNNLTKAQSDLVQAKYEYIFRTKILDFYYGRPIEL